MSNKRIIFNGALNVADATETSTAFTWNNVEGVQPPTPDTPLDAEHHFFILNEETYQCNYFLDGDTKFKAAYKVDNVDTIMLELIKETGLANIKLRRDKGLTLRDINDLVFYNTGEVKPIVKKYIINQEGNTCTVLYEDGTFSLESEE